MFLISMSCGQKKSNKKSLSLKEANIIQKRVKCMASDIINVQSYLTSLLGNHQFICGL